MTRSRNAAAQNHSKPSNAARKKNYKRSSNTEGKRPTNTGKGKGARTDDRHHFSHRHIPRGARRSHQRGEPDAFEVAQQLDAFMEAMATGKRSPKGEGGSTYVREWSEAHGAASFLEKRNLVVDSEAKFSAMVELKNQYGFQGKIILDVNVLSKELVSDLTNMAAVENIKIKESG